MTDLATLAMACACWLAFGYKLRHLRQRSGQPGVAPLRALVWVLGLAGALATVTPVAVGQAVDPLLGLSGVTGRDPGPLRGSPSAFVAGTPVRRCLPISSYST